MLVTFVIPSVGRPTLRRSLESLDAQTEKSFRAILVMDGCSAPDFVSRFPWLKTIVNDKRTGRRNHAGEVRNRAISETSTEWVAFLDDDDTVSPTYVQVLREEIERTPKADVVSFRMRTNKAGRLRVLPPPGSKNFTERYIGISFAARRNPLCFDGTKPFRFEPGGTEDFVALDWVRRNGGTVALSPKVCYFVEMDPCDASEYEVGETVVIN